MTATREIDVTALGHDLIEAVRTALPRRAPSLQAVGEMELRRLAGTLVEIGTLVGRGAIDSSRASTLVDIHVLSARRVLRAVEGLALLPSEQAVRAALREAAGVINPIAGYRLL